MSYKEEEVKDAHVKDLIRARESLMEELEAIIYYEARVSVTTDKTLKGVLEHNRDDEKEHATLLIEWIRRNDPAFEKELKEILFSKKELKDLWD
ncbi:MAG: ferritin [Thermoplasmata archaeon]